MLNITETKKTLRITEAGGNVIKIQPSATKILKVNKAGIQGPKGDTPTLADVQVKQDAEAGNSSPVYDETDPNNPFIISMTYEDANGATNHSKVFNYSTFLGERVGTSIVSTFTYLGQVWTYTKTINYKDVGGVPVWDGTDSFVNKI